MIRKEEKMTDQISYSPEVRGRAVRLVFEQQKEYGSQWPAIKSIASKIGCTAETLRTWVRRAETDQGIQGGMSTSDQMAALITRFCPLTEPEPIVKALKQAMTDT
ncbi:MAG: hypothetical protein DU489_07700 [Nitrosomonas sp.]